MGFEAVPLDEKLPSLYLDKYEPTKGKVDYLFICSPKKWRTDIHFSEELKSSFHCFDGLCCKVFPKKSTYTIYLVAQYVEGRNAKSSLVLKFLRAGKQLDDAIRSIAEQFEDPSKLTKLDLKVELDTSKSEKFKMPKVTPCVDGKRMANAEALADLKEQIKAFLPNLQQAVANVYTEEQFIQLCKEHDIDVDSYTEDTTPKSKISKKVEEVEEPEDIEDVNEPEDVENVDDLLSDDVEEETIDEPEEKSTKKASTTTKKVKKEEIENTNFDLDSLLI